MSQKVRVDRKAFTQKRDLDHHKKKHSDEKHFYRCDFCKKTFTRKEKLRKHFLVHSGETTHTCATFARNKNLQTDIKTHFGQKRKTFAMKNTLCTHGPKRATEKPCSCNKCGKLSTSVEHLKKHMSIHELVDIQHTCTMCGKSHVQKEKLNAHTVVHNDEKPHLCNVCGKSFKTKGSLNSHMKSHTAKGHACAVCGETFSRTELNKHILNMGHFQPI